jgi:hypothetical protein
MCQLLIRTVKMVFCRASGSKLNSLLKHFKISTGTNYLLSDDRLYKIYIHTHTCSLDLEH